MQQPTVYDVAKRAGVSIATVSRALHGSRRVRPDSEARVIAAVTELGYRPNALARGLRLQSSGTIGIVVPGVANPFFAAVAEAVETELQSSGRGLLLANSLRDPVVEASRLQELFERQVDGLIVVPCDLRRSAKALAAAADRVPVVQLDRRVDGVSIDWVGIDDASGFKQILDHLVERGAHSVHLISAAPITSTARRRLAAFKSMALRRHLVSSPAPALEEFTTAWGRDAGLALIETGKLPDAIVCGDDAIALGVLQACYRTGIVVPRDVMVTGFDDVIFSTISNPPLTTVRQPVELLARESLAMLAERAEGSIAPVRRIALEPTLIVRASTVGVEDVSAP